VSENPRLTFLSIFVDDLREATRRYQAMLGVAPGDPGEDVPAPHPFAASGPVVFTLGAVRLALYQCNQSTTHVGDVGIGLTVDGSPRPLAGRAREQGGQVFHQARDGGRELVALMTPDRHFFEVVGRASRQESGSEA
jgi:hypothetical protein